MPPMAFMAAAAFVMFPLIYSGFSFNLSGLSFIIYIKLTGISISYNQEVSPQLSETVFLWVWLIVFQWCITSKWSVPLATSHHSNIQMSVGGSEVLSACLPIGPSTGYWHQRISNEEIQVCISKGQWRQMEDWDVQTVPSCIAVVNVMFFLLAATACCIKAHPKQMPCTA